MARKRRQVVRIRWTAPQREVAELYNQGKTVEDIVNAGYSRTMISRVGRALARGEGPPGVSVKPPTKTPIKIESAPPSPSIRKTPPDPQTTVRGRVIDPVAVGSLLIIPEDCYITQHGWYLIHDTYKLTQQRFDFGGTMGEFLVEICQVFRDILQYPLVPFVYEEKIKEVISNDGGEESNGRGIQEQDSGGIDPEGFEDSPDS